MTQENNAGNWSQQVWQQPPAQAGASQPSASAPVPPASQPASCMPAQPGPQQTAGYAAAQPGPQQPAGYAPAQPNPQRPASHPGSQVAFAYRQPGDPRGYGMPVGPSAGMPAGAPGAVAVPVPVQPKKRGWIVALTGVVLMFVLLFYGMSSCTSALSSAAGSLDAMSSYSSGPVVTMGDTVAVIEITGTIDYDWSNCSPEGLKYQLDVAEGNPDIKAVVLRINSGGGTSTAGEEMAAYVREFSKPIVVSSAATNASAAYEISSQSDYIFVGKSTMIGSIGTVIQLTDLSGLYEMLGINVENIVSSDNKDSTYGTRALTDEERAHYQGMVNQINEVFIETVAEGRGMDVEAVRALATGLVYTGTDAVENGLADEIGGLDAALNKAAELAGIVDYDVVYLEPSSTYDLYSLLGMEAAGDDSVSGSLAMKEMGDGFGIR